MNFQEDKSILANGSLSQQIKCFDGFVHMKFRPNIWWKAKWININIRNSILSRDTMCEHMLAVVAVMSKHNGV